MRHDLRVDGPGFRLRPVELDDAALIVQIRTRDAERNAFIHPISSDPADQEAWLSRYLERPGDYYFVIERHDGRAEGLISIYDIDEGRGQWGRWVILPQSPSAPESALLIYTLAFEQLGLDEVFCQTIAANEPVVSFHDSCGLERAPCDQNASLGGESHPLVEHRLRRESWPDIKPRLERISQRIARKLSR